MSADSQSILDAALALPEADRTYLVDRLLESLPPDNELLSEEELFAELDTRRADFEQGTAKAVPWSELRKEL